MSSAVALHRLLLASAERDPDAAAYGPRAEHLSYGELAARAARVAGALREAGVRRGARVVVALDGRAEYLVACYGVLMAGASVVPISPGTRARGLGHVLRHSGAVGLVAERPLLSRLADVAPAPAVLRALLEVDGGRGGVAAPRTNVSTRRFGDAEREADPLYDDGAHGADLASVNYTSGTTGPPKGVMLSHSNVVANVLAILRYLGLGPRDRAAMVLPYHYVYGSSVLHTHVAAGASVVPAGSPVYPARVLETVWRERCTGLSGVPSTFAALLRAPRPGPPETGPLRYLTQAGGPMPPALARRVRVAYPEARLFLMYGQTEASARLSYLPPEDLDRKPGSVGIPVPGVSLSVADADGRSVPPGTVGEIVVVGPNVMLGYLGDAPATAEALRGGMLHTGDMGYLDDEGYLYVAGRRTEMISSGGHRIGPREIEDVVSTLPEVAECAAVGVEDETLGQRIVVVVVPRDGVQPDARAIQRACLEALPRFKVPSEVRLAAELPRSGRGKLLRTALRERLEGETRAEARPRGARRPGGGEGAPGVRDPVRDAASAGPRGGGR